MNEDAVESARYNIIPFIIENQGKKELKDLRDEIDHNVRQALAEDIGAGDLTALLIPGERM